MKFGRVRTDHPPRPRSARPRPFAHWGLIISDYGRRRSGFERRQWNANEINRGVCIEIVGRSQQAAARVCPMFARCGKRLVALPNAWPETNDRHPHWSCLDCRDVPEKGFGRKEFPKRAFGNPRVSAVVLWRTFVVSVITINTKLYRNVPRLHH